MRRFLIERASADLTCHAGLALVGRALDRYTNLAVAAPAVSALRAGAVSHSDVLRSYIALLCLGKSDFEAIDAFREDAFFVAALGLTAVPSEATLRQRLGTHGVAYRELVDAASEEVLRRMGVPITPLANGLVPVDCDRLAFKVRAMRARGSARAGEDDDGYAPTLAYVGTEGWCLGIAPRSRNPHCQLDGPKFLDCVLERARRLCTRARGLLLRGHNGSDAMASIAAVTALNERHPQAAQAHYLIPCNPCEKRPEDWLAEAERGRSGARWRTPGPGKRMAVFSVVDASHPGAAQGALRRVLRVTERTIDACGRALSVPVIEVEGWWTSLPQDERMIIALADDHSTRVPFYSELKTDLGLEYLPSGKCETHAPVLTCAQLAYNLLRWIGAESLRGAAAPLRHQAELRHLRTVIQESMYLAARLVSTGRRLKLVFGSHCPAAAAFRRVYTELGGH
jgi:hypothetical protein